MELVFNDRYDIKLGPLGKLHPFDSQKYGRAMSQLRDDLGNEVVDAHLHSPEGPASLEQLSTVHSAEYLNDLNSSLEVARALEVPLVQYCPHFLVNRTILNPMKYACAGSIMAAEIALDEGLCVNMSGGYHHAKPNNGEGFCLYSDISLAVQQLRDNGLLERDQVVGYIDLDAHQGNGVSHCFLEDSTIKMFDIFNADIYPAHDRKAIDRIDFPVPVRLGCKDDQYLGALKDKLPGFLDDGPKMSLVIYNAGTDVFAGDPLGGMKLSREAVLERDLFVLRELRSRQIPTMMLPSGGYTKESFELIAESIRAFMVEDGSTKK